MDLATASATRLTFYDTNGNQVSTTGAFYITVVTSPASAGGGQESG